MGDGHFSWVKGPPFVLQNFMQFVVVDYLPHGLHEGRDGARQGEVADNKQKGFIIGRWLIAEVLELEHVSESP